MFCGFSFIILDTVVKAKGMHGWGILIKDYKCHVYFCLLHLLQTCHGHMFGNCNKSKYYKCQLHRIIYTLTYEATATDVFKCLQFAINNPPYSRKFEK